MRTGSALVAVLALLCALPVAGPAAQPRPWDGARVAELAGELGRHSEEMRQAVRQQAATESIASGQSRATENLIDDLRGMRVACNRLRRAAEDGKARDDTLNLFRRIDEIHRDAAEELRRMFLTEANLDRVKQGRVLLEELRLYYTGTVDPRPDLVGPSRDPGAPPD